MGPHSFTHSSSVYIAPIVLDTALHCIINGSRQNLVFKVCGVADK